MIERLVSHGRSQPARRALRDTRREVGLHAWERLPGSLTLLDLSVFGLAQTAFGKIEVIMFFS